MLTPELLRQHIASFGTDDKRETDEHTQLAKVAVIKAEPQLGLMLDTADGPAVLPYVRLTGIIPKRDKPQCVFIAFGEAIVTVTRPQQPPDDSGNDEDRVGGRILAAVLVGIQDQTLRELRNVTDILEVAIKLVPKK